MKVSREFFMRDGITVAKELLGKKLVNITPEGKTSGIICETEIYMGEEDKACHCYGGKRTKRTEVLYKSGGHIYVYLIYGMHVCMNISANIEGVPHCILLRALIPKENLQLMEKRRNTQNKKALCSGPAKLTQAMGIDLSYYGKSVFSKSTYVEDIGITPEIVSSTRININYAGDDAQKPYRFLIKDCKYISKKY